MLPLCSYTKCTWIQSKVWTPWVNITPYFVHITIKTTTCVQRFGNMCLPTVSYLWIGVVCSWQTFLHWEHTHKYTFMCTQTGHVADRHQYPDKISSTWSCLLCYCELVSEPKGSSRLGAEGITDSCTFIPFRVLAVVILICVA